jgi:hypothetical protein
MRDDHQHLERTARLIEEALAGRLSRRELIARGLALGLSLPAIGAALTACGATPPRESSTPLSRWQPTAGPATPTAQALSGSFQPTGGAPAPQPTPSLAVPPVPITAAGVRFAVIGDYGLEGEPAAAVAGLVASWSPDFVVTTGDNNYPDGLAETLERNVGQYYGQFIGGAPNRFWPVLGNHDWNVGYPEPYLSYFALPGNGRYYSVEQGPVALFALDSMPGEPDGIDAASVQAGWLREALAGSTALWKIVVFHHPPYSSGHHGPADWMRWPFAEWGARLVLCGHDHTYERVARDGITYVVNGLGGGARYARGFNATEGSQLFFNADHGAMLIEADAASLRARFITRAEQLVDEFAL